VLVWLQLLNGLLSFGQSFFFSVFGNHVIASGAKNTTFSSQLAPGIPAELNLRTFFPNSFFCFAH
jgi:hypothetical protein